MIELQTMPLRFRVWDKDEKMLIYEAERVYDFLYPDPNPIYDDNFYDLIHDDRYIISQDTGLKDKNGKSIYTGDIARYGLYDGFMVIKYVFGQILGDMPGKPTYTEVDGWSTEIVGNIWQNPELLEEK